VTLVGDDAPDGLLGLPARWDRCTSNVGKYTGTCAVCQVAWTRVVCRGCRAQQARRCQAREATGEARGQRESERAGALVHRSARGNGCPGFCWSCPSSQGRGWHRPLAAMPSPNIPVISAPAGRISRSHAW